jgi:hypothetical protein
MLHMIVELKREDTLLFLYINGKTNRCWTSDHWFEAAAEYDKEVDTRYNEENKQRKLVGRNPVTRESFERYCKRQSRFTLYREPMNAVLS